jgi:hypothetical protein
MKDLSIRNSTIACIQVGSLEEIRFIETEYYSDQVWIHSRVPGSKKLVTSYEERVPLHPLVQLAPSQMFFVGYIQQNLALPVGIECVAYGSTEICNNGINHNQNINNHNNQTIKDNPILLYWFYTGDYSDKALVLQFLRTRYPNCQYFVSNGVANELRQLHSQLFDSVPQSAPPIPLLAIDNPLPTVIKKEESSKVGDKNQFASGYNQPPATSSSQYQTNSHRIHNSNNNHKASNLQHLYKKQTLVYTKRPRYDPKSCTDTLQPQHQHKNNKARRLAQTWRRSIFDNPQDCIESVDDEHLNTMPSPSIESIDSQN